MVQNLPGQTPVPRRRYACRVLFKTEKGQYKNDTVTVWAFSFGEAAQSAITNIKRLKHRRMNILSVTARIIEHNEEKRPL